MIKNFHLDCVVEQAGSALIQMVIVAEADGECATPDGCELAPLSQYQNTVFEEERSSRSSDGRTTPEDELTNYRSGGDLSDTPVEIRYYQGDMPHQRFILTDQFALEIDRGLDFLDRATHKNRDVSVNTKSHTETSKLLAAYSGNHISTDIINSDEGAEQLF